MSQKLKPICIALSALFFLAAESSHATSLLQAYKSALANDPLYNAAKADRAAGREYAVIGQSGLLPSVQYSYSTSKVKGETIRPLFGLSHEDYRSSSKGVSIKQVLFNGDAYARYEQGIAQSNLSESQFDARSQELTLRLVSSYADANYAMDQVSLYIAQRDALLEQRKVNDKLFEKGEGTRTDMLETQAKLDVSESMLLEAHDALQNSRATLASIVGEELGELDRLVPNFKPVSVEGSLEDWKKIAEERNPEISAARYAVEIAEKDIDKAKAAHMPRVDLNAAYNRSVSETVATKNQDNNTRTIGVQLVIPIYSGGYANAALKQAIAHRDRAKAEFLASKEKLFNELGKQFNAVKSGVARIEAMGKTVSSASLLVEATRQSVKGGIRINADLLNSEQQLMTAKRDLASARYTYLLSMLKLKIAAGTMNYDDLKVVAAYFVKQ